MLRKKLTGGRNNQGHYHGPASGRRPQAARSRLVDFRRTKDNCRWPGSTRSNTIRIALRGSPCCIMFTATSSPSAPDGLKTGAEVMSGPDAPPAVGNCLPLKFVPLGMTVHNIELQPGRGGRLCRSAGLSASSLPAKPTGPS